MTGHRPRSSDAPWTTDSDDDDPVIACVGDSALWCTGTRYEDKTPNLVHRILTGSGGYRTDGDPIPPAQFRARGGAIIGVSYPWRVTQANNWGKKLERKKDKCSRKISSNGFSADDCKLKVGAPVQFNRNAAYLDPGDVYGFIKHDAGDWYDHYSADRSDVNQLKWTIARDIGWHWPRVVDQLEQFPRRGESKPSLDVPRDGTEPVDQFGGPVDDEPPYAEDVDVLLVNGGTNDIELSWLNNPTKVDRDGIRKAVRKHCYEDQKALLRRARDRFPNAVILAVGYYPYASDWTVRKQAENFLSDASSIPLVAKAGVTVEAAVDNALNFARMQSYYMRKAVTEVASEDDGPGTVFVHRGFGVVNAFDAPEPWSWGYPADRTDDTGDERRGACNTKHDSWTPGCVHASIGHPNTDGCEQTARAAVDRYREHNDLPVGTVREWADGEPTSLRAAFENYDFDPDGEGLRQGLAHRVVDSIRVDLETGDSADGLTNAPGAGKGGAKPGPDPATEVYLRVEPGRPGNGERFRLETEENDFQAGSVDRFFLDPLMSRKMSGDVGPILEENGMDQGTWNYQEHVRDDHDDDPSHVAEAGHSGIPYIRGDHWTADPLRLGDVERLVLDVEKTNFWSLERVTVELNGIVFATEHLDDPSSGIEGDVEVEVWRR